MKVAKLERILLKFDLFYINSILNFIKNIRYLYYRIFEDKLNVIDI